MHDRHFCKRADSSQKTIRFGDLKARFIGLFSCIGFSATAEIYSSDSSLILDGVEGYPIAITTSDRIFRMIPSLPLLWLALRTQNYSMIDILDLLNDIQARYEGSNPYLLVGDPWVECERSAPNEDGANESNLRVHVIPTEGGTDGILRSATRSSSDLLVSGERRAVLLSSVEGPLPLPVLSVREDFDTIREQLEQHSEALIAAFTIERSLRLAMKAAKPGGAVLDRLDTLAALRNTVESAIDCGLCSWHQAQTTGVRGTELDACLIAVHKRIGDWDQCMADIAAHYLLDRSIEDLLGVGRRVLAVKSGNRCNRCDNVMRWWRPGSLRFARHRPSTASTAPCAAAMRCSLSMPFAWRGHLPRN